MKCVFPLILKKQELKNTSYTQRGKYHFLNYDLISGISGKNAGFCLPPIKFLSQLNFFVKIDNSWFNLKDYFEKVKIESFETIHYYKIKDILIEIKYFIPDNYPLLRIFISSNKKIKLRIFPKISFDYIAGHKNPIKGYEFKHKKNNFIFSSKLDEKVIIGFNFNKFPKLNKKNKNISSFELDFKKTNINLVCSLQGEKIFYEYLKEGKKDLKNYKIQRYKNHIVNQVELNSDNPELNENFQFAKYNLLQLRHRQPGLGRGFLAGMPYFPSYFARDIFWSFGAIVALGDFENAEDCLNMFAKYQSLVSTESKKPGKIPHEIWLNGEPNYYSIDSSLLFVISVKKFYDYTKNKEYVKNIFPSILRTINFILDNLKDGRIIHGKMGFVKDTTWMDSYNRGESAVEVQGLVVECLNAGIKLAEISGNRKYIKKWKTKMKKSRKVLNIFIKDGFVYDHLNKNKKFSKSITANPLFLFYLNLLKKKGAKKILEFLKEKELFCEYGVRSRAKKSKSYSAGSYHKGGVWPFLSGIYLKSLYNYNLPGKEKVLEWFSKYFRDFSPGLSPEYIDGNKFCLKSLKHNSCFLCLWSSSLYIESILEGMCGIKIEGNKLKIKPNLPNNVNKIKIRNFRFNDNFYDFEINNKNSKIRKLKTKKIYKTKKR